jgi:quinolinate synthase
MTSTDVAAQLSTMSDAQLSGRGDAQLSTGSDAQLSGRGDAQLSGRGDAQQSSGGYGADSTGSHREQSAGDRSEDAGGDWAQEVRRLAAQRDAVILAHNYQAPEIQDVADHVGDSLALSRLAAQSTASVIVFAGVYFMAETAKILAPDRTVLIPEPEAGCSLADTITAPQVRDWKAEHPGAAVVAYVNTSAEVKAEADLCCTSANAAQIVASLPAEQEVLFLPDQFLGAYVQRATGRPNMHIWMGECHVHAGISPAELRRKANADPAAELFIHPECGCSTAALWQTQEGDLPESRTRVLSTGGMLDAARTTTAATVLVATETGMLHQLRRANPAVRWEPVNPGAVCRFMKMTTPASLLRCLREGTTEVQVPADIAERARRSVQAMIGAGTSATALPGAGMPTRVPGAAPAGMTGATPPRTPGAGSAELTAAVIAE